MNKEGYKGLYAMHKYWGKKPFNQIDYFINKYSKKGDLVLDSFCGSGITIIESLKNKRNAIGVDLNPIAVKLANASIESVDIDLLKKEYLHIKNKCADRINSLYEREYNGKRILVTHVVWNEKTIIEIWYREKGSLKKHIKKPDLIDYQMSENPNLAHYWIPNTIMYENSRINVKKEQKISDLFTKRALSALSIILDEISSIENESIRNTLELTFSGALSQCSKLVFVIKRRNKKTDDKPDEIEVGSWVIGYWLPKEHFEINVWNCFENRFKKVLKGKEDSNKIIDGINNTYSIKVGDATELELADESVDYVFIDPPHGNRILYLEQSLMWNSWLRLDKNIQWDKEIIISEAKSRKKTLTNYINLLEKSFKEIKRVLKKDHYFSLAFNCFNDDTWIELLNLLFSNGFMLTSIEPLEYSALSVVQANRVNGLKTDFVFTFKNSDIKNNKIILNNDQTLLNDLISKKLNKNKDLEVFELINELFIDTIPKGYIFSVEDISKKLNLLKK